jgi:hypothetical protein
MTGRLRGLVRLVRLDSRSQSNEAELLAGLAESIEMPPTFIEFGFAPLEMNVGSLIRRGFTGVLIDASGGRAMRLLRWRLRGRVDVLERFLTVENIGFLGERYRPGTLGVLSVDVDGNDYWLLRELLPIRPAVIAVEYNASLGPSRRVTVPYDPAFDRHQKHPSGMYHGASLAALAALCDGYRLVAVAAGGANAIFARNDVAIEPGLDPEVAWQENALRNEIWGTTAAEQWEQIKALPFHEV